VPRTMISVCKNPILFAIIPIKYSSIQARHIRERKIVINICIDYFPPAIIRKK
jgi:hypothetical protein